MARLICGKCGGHLELITSYTRRVLLRIHEDHVRGRDGMNTALYNYYQCEVCGKTWMEKKDVKKYHESLV